MVTVILKTLKKTNLITDYYLNTESEKIALEAKKIGAKVFLRDAELAQDNTTTEEILANFSRTCNSEYVAAINPTNPLLSEKTIDDFFKKLIETDSDTCFSVSEHRKHFIKEGIPVNYCPFGPHPRTQDVIPMLSLNWAIVAWRTCLVKQQIKKRGDSIYLGKVSFFKIPALEAFDIDTQEDFDIAEMLYMQNRISK